MSNTTFGPRNLSSNIRATAARVLHDHSIRVRSRWIDNGRQIHAVVSGARGDTATLLVQHYEMYGCEVRWADDDLTITWPMD